MFRLCVYTVHTHTYIDTSVSAQVFSFVHFNRACPFNIVLKVRWPSAASCELQPNCNWFYANAFVCCSWHSHTQTYKHTYWCNIFPVSHSFSLSFSCVNLGYFALFRYYALLFHFWLWVKSYFRFHFNATALSCTYICIYVCSCVKWTYIHIYVHVCRSMWHNIDWHQNNRV